MLETLGTSSNGLRGQSIWCGGLTPEPSRSWRRWENIFAPPNGSAADAMELARTIGEDASRSQVLRGSHLVSMPANGKRCSQKPLGVLEVGSARRREILKELAAAYMRVAQQAPQGQLLRPDNDAPTPIWLSGATRR
jgi:hypothetical protein